MVMEIENHIDLIINWLRQQVESSKTSGLLVGISGGIDSAVVAYLIKKAFPNNSLGVILPVNSSQEDVEDALLVAKNCGIIHFILDLTQDHQDILNKVTGKLQGKNLYNNCNLRTTDANLRARLRMSALYSVANNLNYLVVGTDNASELYTGYFTKYGDGGVDLLPIANLRKYEVYEWARVLGIPQEIIDKEPSAGLWEGQKDELEMGVSYKSIDDYLDNKPIDEVDKGVIESLHNSSKHKREMPVFPRLR